MLSPRLRITFPILLCGLFTACNNDGDRIAGAGIDVGPSAFQNRLGGFSTSSPDANVVRVGDLDGDGVADYVVGDAGATGGGRVVARSGAGHQPLWTIDAPSDPAGFGTAIADAGDLDQDGKDDVLVGAPEAGNAGFVAVLSGANGSTLRTLNADNVDPIRFGTSAAKLGDVNGDGVADHAIGASGLGSPTAIYLFSGADGSRIDSVMFEQSPVVGTGPTGMFPIGDITGDQIADIVLGFDGPETPVLNGSTATVIRRHPGRSVAADSVGDLNGDGVSDYAIGYPARNDKRGQVEVFSGVNGARLLVLDGTRGGGELGHSIAGLGDRDGDGVGDILVGGRGYALLYSGATGQLIGELNANDANRIMRVTSLGDVNKDGKIDYVLGDGGNFVVLGGAPQALAADRFEVPVSVGGTQLMTIDAGADHAGKLYYVFGAYSGTSPGVDLGGGLLLPLNPDSYTSLTAQQTTSNAIFVNFAGRLDENGRGQAALNVPGNLPAGLVGITLHHAALLTTTEAAIGTTNAVPLSFTTN